MGLQQQPDGFKDGFKAEFARTAPAGSQALYEAQLGELRDSFSLNIRSESREAAAARSTLTTEIAWEPEGHFDPRYG